MQWDARYSKAPPGWSYTDPNPFSPDGSYGSAWSAFCLLDKDDDQFITGQSGGGPFSARFGRRVPHLDSRLADYLRYENRHHRTVILSFPENADIDRYVNQALACTAEADIVRPDDPPILVHATTPEAWENIQADGALKAASRLKQKPRRSPQAGRPGAVAEYLSHEPPEYADYIMFGVMDSCVPEMVVASNRAGRFIMDPNAAFEPGVRLYLDNHRIIQDGLGTRDGLHVMKVHFQLPVRPYVLAAVGVKDIDPEGKIKAWTLRSFVDGANAVFRSRFAAAAK